MTLWEKGVEGILSVTSAKPTNVFSRRFLTFPLSRIPRIPSVSPLALTSATIAACGIAPESISESRAFSVFYDFSILVPTSRIVAYNLLGLHGAACKVLGLSNLHVERGRERFINEQATLPIGGTPFVL